MKALIDGDIFGYEMGSLTKKEPEPDQEDIAPDTKVGELLPFEVCWGAVQSKIERILEAVKADEYMIYLSSPEIQTWRMEAATIKPYKGHRDDKEKPAYWELIRSNLAIHYPCEIVEFMEADDALSIEQYQDLKVNPTKDVANTVICSRDKDLNMVPGFHYAWACGKSPERELWWQDELGGLREFYKQVLMGDVTDNIPGLFGVGEKSALVKKLADMESEREMFNHVFKCYQDRFGSYAQQFLIENGQLLWMQRTPEDRWNPWKEGKIDQWKEEELNEPETT